VRRAVICLLLLAVAGHAQDLEKKLADKLAKPFVAKGGWVLDFDEAKAAAKKRNVPILAYFTASFQAVPGSDTVEDGLFLTDDFVKLAKEVVPFLHVTAMIEGRKDDDLLARLGGRSLPWMAFLDCDGTVLASHDGAPTVAAFRETLADVTRTFALRDKAAAGDRDAIVAYALDQARRFRINSRQLRAEMARAGELKPDEQAAYRAALRDLLFEEADHYARGEWYARMEKDGLVPEDERQRTDFYLGILAWAEFQGDVETFKRALGEIRKLHGDKEQAAGFFRQVEEKLKDMEERQAK